MVDKYGKELKNIKLNFVSYIDKELDLKSMCDRCHLSCGVWEFSSDTYNWNSCNECLTDEEVWYIMTHPNDVKVDGK